MFETWSPVTLPLTTMVTASQSPRVRAEPLVRGLRADAEGLADFGPRRTAFVCLDDEPREDPPQLGDRVIEPCCHGEEVVRTSKRRAASHEAAPCGRFGQRGSRAADSEHQDSRASDVAFCTRAAPIPSGDLDHMR